MKAKILVAGATGTNGQALLKELSARNVRCRALVRDIEKARPMASDTVELVPADFAEIETLDAAFAGIQKAFVAMPVHQNSSQWFSNFFRAAKTADIEHLVKLSAYGADSKSGSEIVNAHGQSDRALLETGIPYTILRPNSFYQNMLWQADAIRTQGRFYLPVGDARISCVDVRDIADAAANILTSETHTNQTYKLTGPEALNYHEVADTLAELSGKSVSYVPITVEASRLAMLDMGLPQWDAHVLSEIQGLFTASQYEKVEDDLNGLLKRTPRTFRDFATDYLPAFCA